MQLSELATTMCHGCGKISESELVAVLEMLELIMNKKAGGADDKSLALFRTAFRPLHLVLTEFEKEVSKPAIVNMCICNHG